ncbi:MAG: MogA/MoaB family molybdenum cofactor biosynthesis protein [Tissierellales bacterium]|nr:MogA/MoaB family molybdenum cofactor biosynthesis protein [Tissierellales bacterium]
MFKVGILTASDKGSKGLREDLSGKLIKEIMEKNGYEVVRTVIVQDDKEDIKAELLYMADELKVDLILTTGGTGFSKRDITPEATLEVVDRLAMGISYAILNKSLEKTPHAMLSRAVSGIRNETLIINLPGSPKAVEESLDVILSALPHGLEILTGRASECARE